MEATAGVLVWDGSHLAGAPAGTDLEVADSWLVDDGRVRGLDLHRARFADACARRCGPDAAELRAFLDAVSASLPRTGRWFPRVECGPASGRPQLRLRLRPAPGPGGPVVLAPHRGPDPRRDPRTKGPDLERLLALREAAAAAGADEVLLTAPDDVVLEGALSSVVWWRDDALCVPGPELPVLDGVTRRLLLDLARTEGIPVRHERRRLACLDGLEVWTLSALHGIRPVTGWRGCDLRPGPPVREPRWTRLLQGQARPLP